MDRVPLVLVPSSVQYPNVAFVSQCAVIHPYQGDAADLVLRCALQVRDPILTINEDRLDCSVPHAMGVMLTVLMDRREVIGR